MDTRKKLIELLNSYIVEHKNIREYRYFKSRLFKQTKSAIGNLDDIECGYMFRQTECKKYRYTCKKERTFSKISEVMRAEQIRFRMDAYGPYTKFVIREKEYILRIPGLFNVYNLLAALQTMKVHPSIFWLYM